MRLQDPIKSIMTKNVVTILKNTPLEEIKRLFQSKKIHHLPVVEESNLVGIISQLDHPIFSRGYNNEIVSAELEKLTAADIMTKGIATLEPHDKIETALKIFKENLFHSIPVVENSKLVGIVTTLDVVISSLEKNTESKAMSIA